MRNVNFLATLLNFEYLLSFILTMRNVNVESPSETARRIQRFILTMRNVNSDDDSCVFKKDYVLS